MKTLINTLWMLTWWIKLELLACVSRTNNTRNKSAEKPTAALLSFALPPQFNSGTHRPLSFLKYASENHWQLFAITNPHSSSPSLAGKELLAKVPTSTPIYEFNNTLAHTSWRFTPALDGGFSDMLAMVNEGVKRFKINKPDIIIASGPPFSFHAAGYYLSRIFSVPLVVDYRDEWTACPFDFVSKTSFDRWMEKRIIKQAQTIIYTTVSHQKNHLKHFDINPSAQAIIYNGWEDDSPTTTQPKAPIKQAGKITISYVGKLAGHVELEPFFHSVNEALKSHPGLREKITLRFIGEKSDYFEGLIAKYKAEFEQFVDIESIGLIPKSQAGEIMRESDYLLMLCNESLASYIPGKLYDYLSQKTPVIAFGVAGEVSDILHSTQSGLLIDPSDVETLVEILSKPPIDLSANSTLEHWLANKTRKSQAATMYLNLNRLIGEPLTRHPS